MNKSFDNIIKDALQEDIEVPEIILKKSELAFNKIRTSVDTKAADSTIYKNKRYTPRIALISAIVLSGIVLSTVMGNSVLASINILGMSIEEFIKVKPDSLESYKAVLDKAITKDGITVKLDEVILDDNQILISSTFKLDKELAWQEGLNPKPKVYINGKWIHEGGGITGKKVDERNYSFLTSINTNEVEIGENTRIKVVYDNVYINKDEKLKGKWVFEFTASKEALLANTETIPINRTFKLNSGQVITIENLKNTPVSTTIHYTMEVPEGKDLTKLEGADYDVMFIVKDQNGKELKWKSGQTMTKNNYFRYDTLSEEVTKIKITPYLISGYEGEKKKDYRRVLEEEAFEVNIR